MSAAIPSGALPLADVLDRWDAIVIRWDLDEEERSMLIGAVVAGPIDQVGSYRSEIGEQRMRIIVELEAVLSRLYGRRRRVRAWLRASNPNLGGRTPITVLAISPQWGRWLIDNLGVAL